MQSFGVTKDKGKEETSEKSQENIAAYIQPKVVPSHFHMRHLFIRELQIHGQAETGLVLRYAARCHPRLPWPWGIERAWLMWLFEWDFLLEGLHLHLTRQAESPNDTY